MGNNIQTFKTTVENASKLLLIIPQIITTDTCASVGLLYKLLHEKMGKDVDVAASRQVPARFHELLKNCGIDVSKFFTEIKPVSYVIRVNDTKDKIDVEWEKINDSIEVVLTPDREEIDFSKVSFAKQGGIYDAVITFNARRLEDLGRIYNEFEKLYSRYDIISINHQSHDAEYAKVSINDDNVSTTSEVLYNIYEDFGYTVDSSEAEIIAHGIIGSTYGLHQVTKNKTYKIISELASKYSVDISGLTTKYFYSMSKDNLKLRERLLRNVRYDESRKTIYSILTSRDFSDIHVSSKDLDGIDYLPFNICKDYDLAFLAYEDNGKSHVLIHSNKKEKDLTAILQKVQGVGDHAYGMATFDGDPNNASNAMLQAIWGGNTGNQTSPTTVPVAQVNSVTNTPVAQTYTQPQQIHTAQQTPAIPQTNNMPVQQTVQPVVQQPAPVQQTAAPVNQPASPFQKSNDFIVDNQAQPLKSSNSFSSTNTPFDPA